jgi:flagellar biosynthesis chaperone FliJ
MDDIWGAYILQHYFPNSVIYNKASVYQDRNVQDLVTNLENEIIGYRNTLKLIQDLKNYENYLPEKAKQFFEIYKNSFNI